MHVLNQQLATGLTWVTSNQSLLEFRLGISRTEAGKEPPGVGGPGMFELYGITGLPTDPRFAGGLTEQGVSGWTTWGRQNTNPQFQDPFVINPKINYSWVMGRQSFKTGYEYQTISTEIATTGVTHQGTSGMNGCRLTAAPTLPAYAATVLHRRSTERHEVCSVAHGEPC